MSLKTFHIGLHFFWGGNKAVGSATTKSTTKKCVFVSNYITGLKNQAKLFAEVTIHSQFVGF